MSKDSVFLSHAVCPAWSAGGSCSSKSLKDPDWWRCALSCTCKITAALGRKLEGLALVIGTDPEVTNVASARTSPVLPFSRNSVFLVLKRENWMQVSSTDDIHKWCGPGKVVKCVPTGRKCVPTRPSSVLCRYSVLHEYWLNEWMINILKNLVSPQPVPYWSIGVIFTNMTVHWSSNKKL